MINRNNAPWAMVVSMGVAALAGQPTFAQSNSAEALGPILEEVVVTARKVEESLQTAPVSVTAFTSTALEERGIVDVNSLANFSPGLSFSQAFGRQK